MSFFVFDFLVLNDVPFEIPEPRESDYLAIVRMPSTKFTRVCNKLGVFGDSGDRDTTGVVISLDKEHVRFFTQGKAGTSTIYCYRTKTVDKTKEPTLIEMKKEEEVSLTFDLRYIISLSKVSALSDQVTICLSSKQPTMFEYKIADIGLHQILCDFKG
ncbi:hypothetical protein U9M48_025886 [Paspalum notatum var. saurae]|uniref:Proliferating cell nuclear antigen PCNA C-terminal domain-containing protein n=1 Tax=Paspalum notatum var. saurae TaxID=547442 RepID=A0AAQ3TRP7_PASNO